MSESVPTALIAQLVALKQQGASAIQAVYDLKHTASDSSAITRGIFVWTEIGASALTKDLKEVYQDAFTPLDAAIILKNLGFPINEVADALHTTFPDRSSLEIGGILLNPQVFPETSRPNLTAALVHAGFESASANLAANILFPVQVTVAANQAWQATGAMLSGTQTTMVSVVSGSWSASPWTGQCSADGDSCFIGKPGYTLPGVPEGALIGRVGGQTFLVGQSKIIPRGLAGILELCINDDLDGRYGSGLVDNTGELQVKVTTAP